jgi:hypothetical protein
VLPLDIDINKLNQLKREIREQVDAIIRHNNDEIDRLSSKIAKLTGESDEARQICRLTHDGSETYCSGCGERGI